MGSYSLYSGRNAESLRSLFSTFDSLLPGDDWTAFPPVWSGGATDRPRIALVFINPTKRNQSVREIWEGDRAPFVGIRRPWRFLASCGILSDAYVAELPPDQEWTQAAAEDLYRELALRGVYVTNLVKSCRINADLPSRAEARTFLPLLESELRLVSPEWIIPLGGLVTSLLLGSTFKLSESMDYLERNGRPLVAGEFADCAVVPSYYPVGRGSPTKARAIISAAAATEFGAPDGS